MKDLVDYQEFMDETGIDKETARELYTIFLEELLDQKEGACSAMVDSDFEGLGKIIHNIKGISASYKAWPVHATAKRIDEQLKQGKQNNLVNELDELVNIIDQTGNSIRHYLGTFEV